MDFQTIFNTIRQTYEQESAHKVYEDSDLSIRMKVFAGELFNLSQQVDFCSRQIFPQTASGIYLERHGACRDLHKKPAGTATGTLLFSRDTAASQNITIPEGTLCTSSSGNGVMYLTLQQAVIKAGASSVSVPARASQSGKAGNIVERKIDTIVSAIAGVNKVINSENFTGGMDDEDEEVFRKRLLQSYLNVSNGANLKFYEDFAMKYDNVWSAKAVYAAGNTLNLYVTDIFRMTTQSLCRQIQTDIVAARELNINVVVQPPVSVTKDLSVTVFVRDLQNASVRQNRVLNYLQDKVYKLGIGEALNPYVIANDISTVLDGFVNLAFSEPATLENISSNQIVKPGFINVGLEKI